MRTLTVYRGIALNEGESINQDNIGCAWTLCEVFAGNHASEVALAKEKDGVVILRAEVSVDQIDWNNTLFAMDVRPNEYEVVLIGDIEAEVYSSDYHLDLGVEAVSGRIRDVEFEDYNNKYDGALTKKNFFSLAEEMGNY